MEDRKLTEKESIEIITAMIARTKERYIGNGNILLMWGYLTVAVSALVWIMLAVTRQPVWNWLWFIIPLVGCIATPVMARRQHHQGEAVTYSDKVTSLLWTVFGLSEIALTVVCLGFSLIGNVNCWTAMLVYSLLMAPGAEIAQGIIIKEKSMIAGALVGLAVGIITVCCVAGGIHLAAFWYMPLFMLAFVAMMIVPGHILNKKA